MCYTMHSEHAYTYSGEEMCICTAAMTSCLFLWCWLLVNLYSINKLTFKTAVWCFTAYRKRMVNYFCWPQCLTIGPETESIPLRQTLHYYKTVETLTYETKLQNLLNSVVTREWTEWPQHTKQEKSVCMAFSKSTVQPSLALQWTEKRLIKSNWNINKVTW